MPSEKFGVETEYYNQSTTNTTTSKAKPGTTDVLCNPKDWNGNRLTEKSFAEEKKEDEMPIAINTTSHAPAEPRPTTTSRRGGRTRSRSPPVMSGRLSAPPEASQLGENPSSVAAAAAAKAKALYTGNPSGHSRSAWPGEDEHGRHPHPGERPSRNWPPEDGRKYAGSSPPLHMRRYPGYGNERASPLRHQHSEMPPEGSHYDRRYRPHRYDNHPRYRGSGPAAHHYPPEYRYGDRNNRSSPPPRGGGTSLVIGGTKPIHVPKRPGGPYERPPSGSAASVFRGRPKSPPTAGGPTAPPDDESPQKILMSLRTPTSSFDGGEKSKKALSLSPDDPPELRNANQRGSADPLFDVSLYSDGLIRAKFWYWN